MVHVASSSQEAIPCVAKEYFHNVVCLIATKLWHIDSLVPSPTPSSLSLAECTASDKKLRVGLGMRLAHRCDHLNHRFVVDYNS